MSLHLWEAVHDADARSVPLFDIDEDLAESTPPSLQRVLLAAATLWCRSLVWPTVREIASTAAVAASTSIRAVGSSAQLRTLLIESERRTVANLGTDLLDDETSDQDAVTSAFRCRVRRLASIDPALARLPLLAGVSLDDRLMTVASIAAYGDHLLDALDRVADVA